MTLQDTEFPGVCYSGSDETSNIFEYDILRNNVNKLKIIQLGITLCKASGEVAEDVPTWQFNFKFDPEKDQSNKESMQLLRSSGFNFQEHNNRGIDSTRFSELLTMSGLVLNSKVRWISFHGDYDFAYLIRLLTGEDLPESKEEFDKVLHIFFPHIFDVKFMSHEYNCANIGLNKLADQLNVVADTLSHIQVKRLGIKHQSGSDSRLTAETYFVIKKKYCADKGEDAYDGILFGTLDVHKQYFYLSCVLVLLPFFDSLL